VTATEANFPLVCPNGQSQVTFFMYDQGSDGWGASTYSLSNSAPTVVRTGSLSAPTDGNIIGRETFCLADGTYTIDLNLVGANPSQVGLQVENCHISLDSYRTSATFTISANTCSFCANNLLDLRLVGSSYGIPYGWHGDSSFYVLNTDNLNAVTGTMTVGIMDTQSLCLPDGIYNISFDGVPASDDFLSGIDIAYYGGYGIEEYEINFACGTDRKLRTFECSVYQDNCVRVMELANIEISGGACTVNYITSGDVLVDPNSAFSLRSIGTTSAMVSMILVSFMWALYLA
jgi:hypothetical protein